MQNLKNSVKQFVSDEDGLTVVEYAVAGGLIAAALVATFVTLGGEVDRVINKIVTALQTA